MPLTESLNGYIELAPSQLLSEKWQELNFDLSSGQNVLQDLVMPESGGGYVFRDAHQRGTTTHNRFVYWRLINDILELVEISAERVLDENQVRIRFANSEVLDVNIAELPDSITIMIATTKSVHRLALSHPRAAKKSILSEINSELLFHTANYYILQGSEAQHPMCATSWFDENTLRCALSFSNSSLHIVQFARHTHHISTYDIKQTGIIGRIWSRMSLAKHPSDCDNAALICQAYTNPATGEALLITLSRDCKIRVFSTSTKECVYNLSLMTQTSFSQSYASHTNPTTEQPMMKMLGSYIIVYLGSEFIILNYIFQDGEHSVTEMSTIQAPSDWEKLVDFCVTTEKIWALATIREAESSLYYLNLKNATDSGDLDSSEIEEAWNMVTFEDELPSDELDAEEYIAIIFGRSNFSFSTVQKALAGVIGPSVTPDSNMEYLKELAVARIVEQEAWARFYNYCIQNHHAANKNIGVLSGDDESVITLIKRSNPSFICPSQDYRGIMFSRSMEELIGPLDYISSEIVGDKEMFERDLLRNLNSIDETIKTLLQSKDADPSKFNMTQASVISKGIDYICEQLDITSQAVEYGISLDQVAIRPEQNPLESNSGIAITFEAFKRLVRARMLLSRDLLIYIHLMTRFSESSPTERPFSDLCEALHSSCKVRRIMDSLRSYAILLWMTQTPVKTMITQIDHEVIDFISSKFKFFKGAVNINDRIQQDSILDVYLHRNLFMNFLVNGGVTFSCIQFQAPQTLSNSSYVHETSLNLCRLLWPYSNHLCFAEFLFTHQLEEQLEEYLRMTKDWLTCCEQDYDFFRACNCLLQDDPSQSVDIFNRLWIQISYQNLLGRLIGLDAEQPDKNTDVTVTPTLIYRYYNKLIQLFQIYNNHQCLVTLINNCMALLDGSNDREQQNWLNCFRAKLFQYYLELENSDEAYHTMVLTTDSSLRINCLRKFIVSHCEKEQWSNLLSYPFIDIKNDFIEILNQKADSSDLSELNRGEYYKTSYYDLLFASYVSDDEFKRAADIMYRYAQRLAHEVPGIVSIRKQADCLLIALNALKCIEDKEAFIDLGPAHPKEDGRSSVLKRSHDSECVSASRPQDESGFCLPASPSKVTCKDIELKYELTRARLRLLQRDQTANAIALSPLTVEETIAQLINSSMFSSAIDLAVLFKAPMDPVLEALTAKYIFIMQLSSVDVAVLQNVEKGLSDIFTDSYSTIDTYNYIANSTSTFVEKLWRLIDYCLTTHDGITHRYSTDAFNGTFNGTTVLMRVVANKLLSSGCDIPASLKRMYMTRNTAELLKLMIKYDKLDDAAELAAEMMAKMLDTLLCHAFTSPFSSEPPVYLPTHLILILINFLKEDATNTHHVKLADNLIERLNKFRKEVARS